MPETIARMICSPVALVMSVTAWWRLLHVLHVGGGVVDQPLAMAEVGAQTDHTIMGTKASAQEPMLVELLQPPRIVHIRLAAGDVLHVAR